MHDKSEALLEGQLQSQLQGYLQPKISLDYVGINPKISIRVRQVTKPPEIELLQDI